MLTTTRVAHYDHTHPDDPTKNGHGILPLSEGRFLAGYRTEPANSIAHSFALFAFDGERISKLHTQPLDFPGPIANPAICRLSDTRALIAVVVSGTLWARTVSVREDYIELGSWVSLATGLVNGQGQFGGAVPVNGTLELCRLDAVTAAVTWWAGSPLGARLAQISAGSSLTLSTPVVDETQEAAFAGWRSRLATSGPGRLVRLHQHGHHSERRQVLVAYNWVQGSFLETQRLVTPWQSFEAASAEGAVGDPPFEHGPSLGWAARGSVLSSWTDGRVMIGALVEHRNEDGILDYRALAAVPIVDQNGTLEPPPGGAFADFTGNTHPEATFSDVLVQGGPIGSSLRGLVGVGLWGRYSLNYESARAFVSHFDPDGKELTRTEVTDPNATLAGPKGEPVGFFQLADSATFEVMGRHAFIFVEDQRQASSRPRHQILLAVRVDDLPDELLTGRLRSRATRFA